MAPPVPPKPNKPPTTPFQKGVKPGSHPQGPVTIGKSRSAPAVKGPTTGSVPKAPGPKLTAGGTVQKPIAHDIPKAPPRPQRSSSGGSAAPQPKPSAGGTSKPPNRPLPPTPGKKAV